MHAHVHALHHFTLVVHVDRPLLEEQEKELCDAVRRVVSEMVNGLHHAKLGRLLREKKIREDCFMVTFSKTRPPKHFRNDIYITITSDTFQATDICARIAFGLHRHLKDTVGRRVFPEHVTTEFIQKARGTKKRHAIITSRI